MKAFSQPVRLAILLAYIVALFAASKVALGAWLPPTTEKGLWFYSGLAALLLGNLLVTPFYAKPADGISYAVAALVALLAVGQPGVEPQPWWVPALWITATSYVVLVLVAAIGSIPLKDSRDVALQKIARSMKALTDALGSPTSIFSIVFLFALLAFHRSTAREYVTIGTAWAVTVGVQPLETIIDLLRRWWEIWKGGATADAFGEVVGHEAPGVVLIRHDPDQVSSFGDTLAVRADDGKLGIALALDHVGFAEGLWLRALHLSLPASARQQLALVARPNGSQEATAFKLPSSTFPVASITDATWTKRDRLLGLVAADTDISTLMVEVVRTDLDLKEGYLLEVAIGASLVLYQIMNGLTKEEILQQKNTRGYVRIHAKKIGCWDESGRRFEVVKWIPSPNAPVFLVDVSSAAPSRDALGYESIRSTSSRAKNDLPILVPRRSKAAKDFQPGAIRGLAARQQALPGTCVYGFADTNRDNQDLHRGCVRSL